MSQKRTMDDRDSRCGKDGGTLPRLSVEAAAQALDPDADIVRQLIAKDPSVFDVLAERFGARLASFLRRVVRDDVLADDILQDVLVRIYESGAACRYAASLSVWVFRIARNLAIDRMRSKRREELWREDLDPSAVSGGRGSGVLYDLAVDEFAGRFEAALRALPEPYRTALLLREKEGLSYEAIGEVMSIPAKTVSTRLVRARGFLRESLAEYLGDGAPPEREGADEP